MNLHRQIANDVPAIKRGMVWCRKCGTRKRVNGAAALAGTSPWPVCCGETMTIDSPAESVVLEFNAKVLVGSLVTYTDDHGKTTNTHTRKSAAVIGGHDPAAQNAVVWIDTHASCVALDRVRPVDGAGKRERGTS